MKPQQKSDTFSPRQAQSDVAANNHLQNLLFITFLKAQV